MDQWLSGLLSAFARDLVCGAVDQLRYPCCFNSFVDDLQGAKDKLITTKDSVNDRVQHGKKQAMKTAQVVHEWLEQEANPLKGNVEDLLEKARINKSCCFGHCPNWIWRYRLAKKLAKKKVQVEKCIAEGREYIPSGQRYERVASLPGIQHLPWEKSLEFDSRQGAYEQLIKALKDDEVTMFGLYGMGGCGKTTMAMELMRTAEAEHLFDKVLFVPVSSNVEVRKIQDKVASALQYTFPEDGERERAQRLCERLTLEKRILVILDDVWQSINFGEIGIPFGENNKNCKVMITTRSVSVCTSMNCQGKISLSTLTDEEAWELFQKQAHISENTPDTLKELGRLISNECKGLPVAIAALAGTLKGKAEVDWKVALDRLRSSIPVNIEKGLQNPYKCLEVSYKNLDTEEAKALLLLCSVYPEDSEISIEELTIFAIGLGLVREVGSFEGARNEVSAAKNELISSSLLLSSFDDDDEEECVKMHDLIRDVVHWIASKENKAIKCVLEKATTLECSSIRYLWCKEFPNELECSCIEFLRLHTELEISDELFKGMERLRVLFLSREYEDGSLSTMSFKSLTNLRCLVLSGWELGDISSIGYMKKLESLMLFECSFFELPDTLITELTNLRLLLLSQCGIKRNPFEVIGRHLQLEELYCDEVVIESDSEDGDYESDSEDGDYPKFFKMSSVPQALQRYRIKFGYKFEDFDISRLNCHRYLILSCFDTSNAVVMELAKKSEVLLAAKILGGAKNVIPDIFQKPGGGTMNCGWIELWLRYSEDIECLVDNSNHSQEVGTPFLELRELRIDHMERLGALYHGVPPSGLFEKLEQLYIERCPMLRCLLTPPAARNLVQLQKLDIFSCDGLKHILEDDDSEISRHDDKLVFSKLKLLRIRNCSMLEYTIPVAFVQGPVQLESLEIYRCDKLEYVFGQGTHGGDKSQNELKIEIPTLEKLQLRLNTNMMSIFPKYCSASCPSLLEFQLEGCPEFDILSIDTFKASSWKLQDVRANGKYFHTLKTLVVNNNFKVESIFSLHGLESIGGVSLGLQCMELSTLHELNGTLFDWKLNLCSLKALELYACPNLTCVFTYAAAQSVVHLEKLKILYCDGLKHVLEDDDDGSREEEETSDYNHRLVLPKLKLLTVGWCKKIEYIIPATLAQGLLQLESLEIRGCDKLEYVFGQGTHGGDKSRNELKIEIPALEELHLRLNTNMMSIFPKYCSASCPSLLEFQLEGCPEFDILSIDTFKASSWKLQDVRANGKHFHTLETLDVDNNFKVESIFSLHGLESIGGVSLGLQRVRLWNLDEIKYVCAGFKNSFTFQNLKQLDIQGCKKLEVIFPASVLRCLPELKYLEISECQELKQIIEEDTENKKSSNLVSPQSCFPTLAKLVIRNCNNLKRLFYTSECNDLPNLEICIIEGASALEELIGYGQGLGDDVGKVKVELPNLKFLMLISLSSLCQGIELPTPTLRLVHNCPKLSLISSCSMLEEFKGKLFELEADLRRNGLSTWNILDIVESHRLSLPEDTRVENPNEEGTTCFPIGPDDEHASSSEVHSTLFGVMGTVDTQSMSAPPLMNKQMAPGETTTTIEIPQSIKREGASSHNAEIVSSSTHKESDNLQQGPLVSSQHKSYPHNIEGTETATNGEIPTSPKPILPTSGSELATPLHIIHSSSIEDKIKESVQEGYTSKDNTEATMSGDIGGNGLGVVVVHLTETKTSQSQKMQNDDDSIQEESNSMGKEGEIGIGFKGSIVVHPDTSSNHLTNVAELEAFKPYVDMDDAQIALLAEAIAVYPHLWKVLAKFSVRFQAWMLKTLADMLFFLRNESTTSVTPQQENEFQKLCDEAVQLGFDKPWVDEMRKRVMVRDPRVGHAETRLNELLKRHDQLSRELCKIKDEIDSLRNFVGSQKKCFDFL